MPFYPFGDTYQGQIQVPPTFTVSNLRSGVISAQELVIDAKGFIRSSNYIPLTAGFKIQGDGTIYSNGNIIIGADGSIIIGAETLGGVSSQFHVHSALEHIALFETDGTDYPDHVLVFDINADIGRIFWYSPHPSAVRLLEFHQDGKVDLANGAALHASDEPAYLFKETVVFTASGTFTKGNYPGLRAIRVRMVGGGGGSGGGANPGAGASSSGGAGGGAGYSESWILAADLDTNEAVTVGAGGAGGAAGNNNGSAGGASIFDTISGEVRALGGGAGGGSASYTPLTGVPGSPGAGAGTSTGNILVLSGGDAESGFALANNRLIPSTGGASHLSGVNSRGMMGTGNTNGSAGKNYGGGASGGGSSAAAGTHAGAAGADGIVIVDVYV